MELLFFSPKVRDKASKKTCKLTQHDIQQHASNVQGTLCNETAQAHQMGVWKKWGHPPKFLPFYIFGFSLTKTIKSHGNSSHLIIFWGTVASPRTAVASPVEEHIWNHHPTTQDLWQIDGMLECYVSYIYIWCYVIHLWNYIEEWPIPHHIQECHFWMIAIWLLYDSPFKIFCDCFWWKRSPHWPSTNP